MYTINGAVFKNKKPESAKCDQNVLNSNHTINSIYDNVNVLQIWTKGKISMGGIVYSQRKIEASLKLINEWVKFDCGIIYSYGFASNKV